MYTRRGGKAAQHEELRGFGARKQRNSLVVGWMNIFGKICLRARDPARGDLRYGRLYKVT